jgi:hypothetical protein
MSSSTIPPRLTSCLPTIKIQPVAPERRRHSAKWLSLRVNLAEAVRGR